MTTRRRVLAYLVALHVVFAGCAAVFLHEHRGWLLAVEILFIVSGAVGFRLARSILEPLDLLRGSAERLRDSDFTTRVTATGLAEIDEVVHVYNDLTDRLREERVRQQEQNAFLERVIAASPAGIVVLDFDGRVAELNPAARRLLGEPAAASSGPGPALAEWGGLATRLAAMPEGEPQVVATTGGRRIRCERAHFIDRGFRRSFFVLEELTEELRRSEKAAYDKLIRMMSHEVNNTTGAVGSLLEASLGYRSQLERADQGDFGSAIEVATARLQNLSGFMRRFADVVRLPQPHCTPADIGQLAEQVAAVLGTESHRRRIAWRFEREPGLPLVACDRNQMEQALLNLYKNALEAIGESGTVTVSAKRDTSHVVLAVRDTGPGLTPRAREGLFTPFHTTKENGQGIGLTLVREILLAHTFEFALDDAPSGGAEFVIRMPV